MANIGYKRASTEEQNIKIQTEEIERYILKNKMILDDSIEINISSRKTLEERKIIELFSMLNENDNLLVCELSRLARSVKELQIIIDTFKEMKVNLILIKEGLIISWEDTNPMTTMFLQVLGMFAEFERNIISMRTTNALASRKGKGILGHNKKFMSNNFDEYEDVIYRYVDMKIPFTTISKMLNADFDREDLKAPALTKWWNKRYELAELTKTWNEKIDWLTHKDKRLNDV